MSLFAIVSDGPAPYSLRSQQVSAINTDFGRRLRTLRVGRGVPQYHLAGALGISVCHLDDIECGREEVSLILLAEIADVFRFSISQLLHRI